MVARWTSDLKVGALRPDPCHRVGSLDKRVLIKFAVKRLQNEIY